MQIKIEIDVQPEELRRFLGLPDVTGLQEELVSFLRDRLTEANESFDPAAFVKANIETIRRNKTLQRLLYGSGAVENPDDDEPASPRGGTSAKRSTSARRRRKPKA